MEGRDPEALSSDPRSNGTYLFKNRVPQVNVLSSPWTENLERNGTSGPENPGISSLENLGSHGSYGTGASWLENRVGRGTFSSSRLPERCGSIWSPEWPDCHVGGVSYNVSSSSSPGNLIGNGTWPENNLQGGLPVQHRSLPMSWMSDNHYLETAMSRLDLSGTDRRALLSPGTNINNGFGHGRPRSWLSGQLSETSLNPNANIYQPSKSFSADQLLQRQRERELELLDTFLQLDNQSKFNFQHDCNDYSFNKSNKLGCQIYLTAKGGDGYSFLLAKLDKYHSSPQDIEVIFSGIKDYLHELMVHQLAHCVVKKLFEVCNQFQLTEMLHSVISNQHNFIVVCKDKNGTMVMQKLLQHLTTGEQKSLILSALRRNLFSLLSDFNGHHLVLQCFKVFSPEENKSISQEIASNSVQISRDRFGCCVIQQCAQYLQVEIKEFLLQEIAVNSLALSDDPYGNYVVQFVLGQKVPHSMLEILSQLSGSFVSLSFNKYSSHVVEKCLSVFEKEHVDNIVNEIMNSEDFLKVAQSSYGNFVVQTAISKSKGAVHNILVNRVKNNHHHLHSHLFGKKVLSKACGKRGIW